ncbi:MAG: DUF4249 family protein [Bacteroidetes bacterium]|nr:DUF4249 family protein [Bacteroidota bacterium]MDA0888306.1 DUF4249 family protein [Bacteroidota bacterium]MDA1084623.1 DUF4249 family protein [Bacteroidota bacterium]
MKKLIFVFGLFLIWSCEDPIDVKLPNTEQNVVIDAMLWRPVAGTQGTLEVVLTKTAAFYSNTISHISGADVSLHYGNTSVQAVEGDTGRYSAENIQVSESDVFTIKVVIDDVVYTATEKLVLSTTIDNITQGQNTVFSDEEVEAIVQFTDRPELGNYYIMDFGYNNLFVTRDVFYNGNQLTFSFYYDEFFPKNTPTPVYLMGVDKDFYTYMQVLISHAGQDGGGPFATAKSTLRGNIQNTADPDAFPLGYFRVVERDSFIFTATEN